MAVKVGELYGELSLETKKFEQGLSASEKKAKGWSVNVGGLFKSIAGALAKATAVATAAITGVAVATGEAASDQAEALSKVKVVFGDLSSSVIDFASTSASSLGLSKTAALGALGTYGNLFTAMGIGADKSADMSTELVGLAADLASFNNLDPTEVLEKLRSGLVGETEPLRSLGVNLNQATIEAKAMELGLWDGNGAIDAAAKAQASYALILDQTKTAQGDFARTSTGMANQQRILSATFQDSMAAVGAAFLPIIQALLPELTAMLQGLADWVVANMPTIQAVIEGVFARVSEAFRVVSQDILPPLITALSSIAEVVFPAIGEALKFVASNWDVIFPAVAAMLAAVVIPAFIAWAVAAGAAAIATITALAPVIAPIAAIGAAVVGLGLLWKRFGGDIMRIVGNIADTVGRVFKGMGDVVSSVWDGVLGAVKGAINGVISVINGFIGAINSIQIHIPEVGVGPVHTPAFDWNGLNLGRIPFLAKGVRNFKGGYAWVGEAGPELAQFPAGTNVFSNRESRSMMGGSMTITHRIEDPSGVLAQMGATPGQLAQMVAESLNGEAFVRKLRHDSVRT